MEGIVRGGVDILAKRESDTPPRTTGEGVRVCDWQSQQAAGSRRQRQAAGSVARTRVG